MITDLKIGLTVHFVDGEHKHRAAIVADLLDSDEVLLAVIPHLEGFSLSEVRYYCDKFPGNYDLRDDYEAFYLGYAVAKWSGTKTPGTWHFIE